MLHSHGWPTAEEEEQERLEAEQEEDSDDEDDDFMPMFRNRLRARQTREVAELPPIPNPEGKKLMREGHFGTEPHYVDRLKQRKKGLTTNLMWRELGIDTHGARKRADQSMSQVSQMCVVIGMSIAIHG